MTVYRKIETSFWQDPFILDLDPEEKYFYLYLMTNTKTSQCGIYEISKTVMQMELGFDRNKIDELIQKFVDYKKIIYSETTHEIMLINWIKYNGSSSPTVLKRVESELKEIKNTSLVIQYLELAKDENIPIDTLSIPYPYPMDTETQKEEKEEEEKEEEEQEEEPKQKSSSSSTSKKSNNDFKEIAKLYQQVIGQPNALTPQWIENILEEYGFEWVKNAMLESERQGKRSKKYVEGILRNWKVGGGMKLSTDQDRKQPVQAKKTRFHNFEQRTDKYSADALEEIAKMKREKAKGAI